VFNTHNNYTTAELSLMANPNTRHVLWYFVQFTVSGANYENIMNVRSISESRSVPRYDIKYDKNITINNLDIRIDV